MAKISIPDNSSVIVEKDADGQVINIHLLPHNQMHLVKGFDCWCYPKVREIVEPDANHAEGIRVWEHYPYQPKWDTSHGFR